MKAEPQHAQSMSHIKPYMHVLCEREFAASDGGAMEIRGSDDGVVNILNCIFTNNTATVQGGAVSLQVRPMTVVCDL